MLTVEMSFCECTIPNEVIKHGAESLGKSTYDTEKQLNVRKAISMKNVNTELVSN